MRKLLIPFMSANSLLAVIAGMVILLRYHARLPQAMEEFWGPLFTGVLLFSPLLALLIALGGPQRPEGLGLLDPEAAQSRARAKSRLNSLLQIVGGTLLLGLAASQARWVSHPLSLVGGILVACTGSLMLIVSPWIALYARWFGIDWFSTSSPDGPNG